MPLLCYTGDKKETVSGKKDAVLCLCEQSCVMSGQVQLVIMKTYRKLQHCPEETNG